jgi:hypothetical protein
MPPDENDGSTVVAEAPPDTPISEISAESPPEVEAPPEVVAPEGEPDAEPDVEPEAPEPAARYADLNDRLAAWKADPDNAEPLTKEERQELSGFVKAEEEATAARQAAAEANRKASEEAAALQTSLVDDIFESLKGELETNGQEADPRSLTFLKREVEDKVKAKLGLLKPYAVRAETEGLRNYIKTAIGNDASAIEEYAGDHLSFTQLINAAIHVARAEGEANSTEGEKKDKEIAKLKGEILALSGDKAKGGVPSMRGGRTSDKATSITKERLKVMEPEAIAALMANPETNAELEEVLRG